MATEVFDSHLSRVNPLSPKIRAPAKIDGEIFDVDELDKIVIPEEPVVNVIPVPVPVKKSGIIRRGVRPASNKDSNVTVDKLQRMSQRVSPTVLSSSSKDSTRSMKASNLPLVPIVESNIVKEVIQAVSDIIAGSGGSDSADSGSADLLMSPIKKANIKAAPQYKPISPIISEPDKAVSPIPGKTESEPSEPSKLDKAESEATKPKSGSFTDIPDYSLLSQDQQDELYAIFDNRFNQLRVQFKDYQFPTPAQLRAKPLRTLHIDYKRYTKHINACNSSNLFRVGLIVMWTIIMVLMVKLGLKPEGYFTSLISNMSVYDDALQELGEMYSFLGSGGHPITRIMIATGTQTALFAVGCFVAKFAGDSTAKIITDSIAQYIGAKPTPPTEKTYEERRIESLEKKQEEVKANPMNIEEPPKLYSMPLDPTPIIGMGLNHYAKTSNQTPAKKNNRVEVPYNY